MLRLSQLKRAQRGTLFAGRWGAWTLILVTTPWQDHSIYQHMHLRSTGLRVQMKFCPQEHTYYLDTVDSASAQGCCLTINVGLAIFAKVYTCIRPRIAIDTSSEFEYYVEPIERFYYLCARYLIPR